MYIAVTKAVKYLDIFLLTLWYVHCANEFICMQLYGKWWDWFVDVVLVYGVLHCLAVKRQNNQHCSYCVWLMCCWNPCRKYSAVSSLPHYVLGTVMFQYCQFYGYVLQHWRREIHMVIHYSERDGCLVVLSMMRNVDFLIIWVTLKMH